MHLETAGEGPTNQTLQMDKLPQRSPNHLHYPEP